MSTGIAVLGGGIGGCIAAVSAARSGARVTLYEPLSALGGTSTLAWVTPWQTFHHTDCRLDNQLYFGLAQELVDLLVAKGGCLGHLPDPIGFSPSLTPYEPQVLADMLPSWVANSGVVVNLEFKHCKVPDAEFYIDASFDLGLVKQLGLEVIKRPQIQPASLIFRVGGVDETTVKQQVLEHPNNFYRHSDDVIAASGFLAFSGFYSEVKKAQEAGDLSRFRDRILAFGTTKYGELIVNTTRVNLDHYADIPTAQAAAYNQVKELVAFMRKYLRGFEKAELIAVAPLLGIRETVALIGEETLSTAEVKSGTVHNNDIALGAFPIDIHRSDAGLTVHSIGGKGYYGIPAGCVVPRGAKNVMVASKCISVEAGAFASTRVSPTVMAIAEQVGKIAAMKL